MKSGLLPTTGEICGLYRRYETTHERSYNKCLADLQRLRAFQLRQRNGFESQRRKNEEHELKMQRLRAKETAKPKSKVVSNVSPNAPDQHPSHQSL